jgi:nuclear protein localization family protein 4
VKESSAVQYVPDVFYVEKDKYGNEIKKAAKPSFPIEFLYTTLATGANLSCENPRLERPSIPFVIENRQYLGEIQSMSAVARHFKQSGSFLSKVCLPY